MAKSKSPKTIEPTNQYAVTIKTADGTAIYSSTDSIEETLSLFKPELIKGKIIVEASKGLKKVNRVLFVYVARRLFFNNVALKIFARNIERALN